MADEQRWHDLARAVVTDAGFDLEDFQVQTAGRRTMVQVIVDGDDGLPLDDAARISRELSQAIDEAESAGSPAFGGTAYTLEVTSPGIGRPLTQPRHFARAAGRMVAVTTATGTGRVRILGLDEGGTLLQVLTGAHGTEHADIPLEQITRAKVEVDFAGPSAAVRQILATDPRTAARFAEGDAATAATDDSDTPDTDEPRPGQEGPA
ncbi:MAG: ribosome maturation factor RimP [Williamsia herbipolensis]|nr:ribosome maturation factor RimP [Williamsia herbipolensis]